MSLNITVENVVKFAKC